MIRWNVVLAGGVGSRFWPLSTPDRPKQLLPLVTEAPMLRDSLDRLRPSAPPERTLVLTSASLREAVLALEPDLPPANVIAEPRPAGTCAALAWAARTIAAQSGPDAVMVCVHADWAIGDVPGFRATLDRAAQVAFDAHALVTVGIVPARPDPGFGYIQPGDAVRGDIRRVARFAEKPDRATAERMVDEGYLWNSGIFAWRVGDLLGEIKAHTPEVQPALDAAGDDLARFFSGVQSVAIDVGVLERSARVLVMPGQFGWDDVGTWAALHRVRAHDAQDNAMLGPAFALHATGNVVHADQTQVVLYGVHDLVVVAREGLVMVTTREKATDLKTLLDALPPEIRNS
ncbi:MAG: mannose-1-phosphate guanylyltransferase [Gemmatimonas sp.]|jgi:mannose-1-phosphate guanylyltransferase|uniref:mannose-1-phosphate guanylyltransferase n=1 Tax=Gemmatimonas sp. TaxID=1962908 RepID=UPI00391F83D6|nr:mannose-1-phosphate guanylyltransferase [Gemmatimonadota bacterium]